MKADQWGEPHEQRRWSMGWQSFRERKADGRQDLNLRCSGCRHALQPGVDRYRCELGRFSTTATAICRQFEMRKKDP